MAERLSATDSLRAVWAENLRLATPDEVEAARKRSLRRHAIETVPPVARMTNAELTELAARGGPYRGKAVFELIDRARADGDAVARLGELSQLPALREDRAAHLVSLAWAAIIGLLAAETPHSREMAFTAFATMDGMEQAGFLAYVGAERIEDAHPRI